MDAGAKKKLRQELVQALGFSEVDDIVQYVCSNFKTAGEVETYLIELLGMAPGQAKDISTKLIKPPKPEKATQPDKRAQHKPEGLVPLPDQPNSRIRQNKTSKSPKVLHSRIINCLKCGRIEQNGSRKCAFCETELRYEELSPEEMDPAVQQHLEKLMSLDQSGESRTTIQDVEEDFYDDSETTRDEDGARKRQVAISLDIESRSFVADAADAGSGVVSRNQYLTKEARELCEGVARQLEKERRKSGTGGAQSARSWQEELGVDNSVVVEDCYNAMYV